jgi:hypothetical protein
VLKQQTLPPVEQTIDSRTSQLGVVIGSYFNTLSPSRGSVGRTLTLTVSGVGLDNVTDLSFQPGDGISTANLNIANDGLSLTVDVSIDSNAPLTQRQLLLSTPTSPLLPVSADADRFDVVAVEPAVESVFPQHIATETSVTPITVTGSDLDNATRVRFEPADGISIGSLTVADDGRSLTLVVSITADAQFGPRVLIVETPAGQSSSIASIGNTLTVANSVSSIASLLSPTVGVEKGVIEPPSSNSSQLATTPLLGIVRQFTPLPEIVTVPLFASELGISLGPVAEHIAPRSIPIGKSANLIVSGTGLNNVTAVSFDPPEDISITSNINASDDGKQLIIPIEIATDAEQSLRKLLLTTANNPILFAQEEQGLLLIAGLTPDIISLDPIQQTQGASFILIIRGLNLGLATSVSASPSTGITIAAPTTNAVGNELTINMIISPNAAPGPRIITVTTPAGTTSSDAIPANTFTIVN